VGWEFFLIPLIALGVLILSTVLRGPPDPKTRPRRRFEEPPRRRPPVERRPQPVAPRYGIPVVSPPAPPVRVEVPAPPTEALPEGTAAPPPERTGACPPVKPTRPRLLRSLASLLDNPRSVALGVVLREVLDRPVSMRQR
jgi:hypothetical protein